MQSYLPTGEKHIILLLYGERIRSSGWDEARIRNLKAEGLFFHLKMIACRFVLGNLFTCFIFVDHD